MTIAIRERPPKINPLLTLVTALKDSDSLISVTSRTIIPQLREGVEWIIKNNSFDISTTLADLSRLPAIRLVNSVDYGIYSALNQALERARGSYFLVIGAGDELMPGAIDLILTSLRAASLPKSAFFSIVYGDSPGKLVIPRPAELSKGMSTPHQGVIMSVDGARGLGFFDESYKIAADYDLVCRFIMKYPNAVVSSQPICRYLPGGLSERRREESLLEKQLIRIRLWRGTRSAISQNTQ